MPTAVDHASPSSSRLLAPIFVYFATAGIVTVMLGPLLPVLITQWQLEDAQAGTLFASFFLGQLIGAWFATRRLRLSVLLGAALTAVGCFALAFASFHTAHLALFAAGLGLGLSLTAGNVIVGTSVANRARTLALLNVAWSIGAITCPELVRICSTRGPHLFFLVTTTLLVLAGLFATTIPTNIPRPAANIPQPPTQATRVPLSGAAMAIFAACLLLYIGNENALGGWLPSFAVRSNPATAASTVALLYWLAELISRLLMAGLLSVITERALYLASLLLLFLTQAALLLATHPGPAVVLTATAVTGAALGPLYPLIVSFLLSRTGQHASLGPLFAFASLGGASLPWFTGVVSTRFGGLRPGLLVPAVATLLLLALAPAIMPRPHETATR